MQALGTRSAQVPLPWSCLLSSIFLKLPPLFLLWAPTAWGRENQRRRQFSVCRHAVTHTAVTQHFLSHSWWTTTTQPGKWRITRSGQVSAPSSIWCHTLESRLLVCSVLICVVCQTTQSLSNQSLSNDYSSSELPSTFRKIKAWHLPPRLGNCPWKKSGRKGGFP